MNASRASATTSGLPQVPPLARKDRESSDARQSVPAPFARALRKSSSAEEPARTKQETVRALQRTYRLEKSQSYSSANQDTSEVDQNLKEFGDFVQTLGGPLEGLHEDNIRELFTNGVYNKHLPTSPPRIMELDRIPAGLRRAHTLVRHSEHIPWGHVQTSKRGQSSPRVRYGAWFLPPADWRVMQPERDPELVSESAAARARSTELRQQVATLQGARLFRDYLLQQQTHVPKFLKDCAAPTKPRSESYSGRTG